MIKLNKLALTLSALMQLDSRLAGADLEDSSKIMIYDDEEDDEADTAAYDQAEQAYVKEVV